jgi:hypothetical protein
MMCDYAIQRRGRSPETNITPDAKLVYPRHPFPPSLSTTIAALPVGFAEMALKTVLSQQVIQILFRMTKASQKGPRAFAEDTSIAVEMMRLSMEPKASDLEKAVVSLSFVFGRFLLEAHVERNINSSQRTYKSMKQPLSTLSRSIFKFVDMAGEDFVVWAVFMLASPRTEYGLSESLQDALLGQLVITIPGVKTQGRFKGELRKYLWHESLEHGADRMWYRMMELHVDGE